MSDIDWDKPLEYLHHCGVASPVIAVVHDSQGRRHAVIENADGLDVRAAEGAIVGTFRNVRRKVKHERMYWLKRHADGNMSFTLNNDTAYVWRQERHDVSEHVETWEADADE